MQGTAFVKDNERPVMLRTSCQWGCHVANDLGVTGSRLWLEELG